MRWSKALVPTLKEDPKEAETKSHRLLLRAGYIRMLMSGVYIYLPLAQRSILKISNIIREEMNRIGAQELLMPALNPIEIWDATGRNEAMGEEMFRLEDRKKRLLCLAPTHEEIIGFIASHEVRSYRELPQVWYQIQTKFRDEPRPRSGILRVREFIMKDSYTLAATEEQLDKSYDDHALAYRRIFTRCGLKFIEAGASSGLMGGSASQEFMVPSENGEDIVVYCPTCDSASNAQIASTLPLPVENSPMKEELVYTPGYKTIEEVSSFLNIPPHKLVKSLLYKSERSGYVMFLVRGDYDLAEEKASRITGEIRPCEPEEVLSLTGAEIGYIGPFGLRGVKFIADISIPEEYFFATGANKNEYHITGKTLKDLGEFEYADIHTAKDGDLCPQCQTPLQIIPTIEIGHIFKLGTKYSVALGATYLDENGNAKPIIMGSYGIGLGRILASAIELYADSDGICLPISIAPFEVIVSPINVSNRALMQEGERIYEELKEAGVDVILDDRDVRAGVKFKDADLVGFPIRITLGERNFEKGIAELYIRRERKGYEHNICDIVKATLDTRAKLFDELKPNF